MTESLNINLAGIVFHINEDAYVQLNDYLASLNKHYAQSPEESEIVADIEARLAEIFQEELPSQFTAVSVDEVRRAIAMLGRPEEIIDEDEIFEEKQHSQQAHAHQTQHEAEDWDYANYDPFGNTQTQTRKLYRNPDERYLAGVAAGLANYLNVRALYIRLAFVGLGLFNGFGLLLYALGWIFMKEAKTSKQKLEMRGQAINLSNLEKTIQDEFEQVGKRVSERFDQVKVEGYLRTTGDWLEQLVEGFAIFIRKILQVIQVAFGMSSAIVGTILLTVLVASLLFANLPFSPLTEETQLAKRVIQLFIEPQNLVVSSIGIGLVLGIPLLLIIYHSVKVAFNLKKKNRFALWLLFFFWIVGCGLTSLNLVDTAKAYRASSNLDESTELSPDLPDTLSLVLASQTYSSEIDFGALKIGDIRLVEDKRVLLGLPKFTIRQSPDNKMKVDIERSAFGENKKTAEENAKRINYTWMKSAKQLEFNHYYEVDGKRRWLNQALKINLWLPVGKVVYLGNNLTKIADDIQNQQHVWDGNMGGKYWKMTPKGLNLLNPEKYDDQILDPSAIREEVQKEIEKELENELRNIEADMKDVQTDVRQEVEGIMKEVHSEIKRELEKDSKTSPPKPSKPAAPIKPAALDEEFEDILNESKQQ